MPWGSSFLSKLTALSCVTLFPSSTPNSGGPIQNTSAPECMPMQKYPNSLCWLCDLLGRLGDMRVPDCRFYDSKMRPLLLVYDNPDTSSVLKDVRIMFKNGDGVCIILCVCAPWHEIPGSSWRIGWSMVKLGRNHCLKCVHFGTLHRGSHVLIDPSLHMHEGFSSSISVCVCYCARPLLLCIVWLSLERSCGGICWPPLFLTSSRWINDRALASLQED